MAAMMAAALLTTGCAAFQNMSKTGQGATIGGGGGAVAGAAIGAMAGGGKGAAIGTAVGAGLGAGVGALIGRRMDKQKAELEKIEGAQEETVTDENDLQAIKVTFNDKILFATGKSDLSDASRSALGKFAASLVQSPETDIAIYGHTDNTGSRAVNQKLSEERAQAVANYLIGQKVDPVRITTRGLRLADSRQLDRGRPRAEPARGDTHHGQRPDDPASAGRHAEITATGAERYDPPRTIAGRIDFSPAGPKNRSSRTRSFVSARQAAERSRIG